MIFGWYKLDVVLDGEVRFQRATVVTGEEETIHRAEKSLGSGLVNKT